jgi:antirestriction protein ArdC
VATISCQPTFIDSGINILSLWASASVQGFTAPIWMTYRQAVELGAHVRKGERGSPVVYANCITRNETDTDSGVEVARTSTSSRVTPCSTSNRATGCPRSTQP